MAESKDTSRNEVEIDLDKYMSLIDKLDEQEDKIKEMQEEAKKARDQLAPPKRKMLDLFFPKPYPCVFLPLPYPSALNLLYGSPSSIIGLYKPPDSFENNKIFS